MKKKRIVLLAGKWYSTPIFYNFLQQDFFVEKVILEEGVPKSTFLKKRIKKLGWLQVSGQVLFQLFIAKPLSIFSKKRIEEIKLQHQLNSNPIPEKEIVHVTSVNAEDSIAALIKLQPDLVVVHGTRIISKKVLNAVPCSFINIHAGITPKYRGSHGAYWALANNDVDNCGVTVHLVDAGIDTGGIIYQDKIPLTAKDNFTTYSYLQIAIGLKLLKKAITNLFNGNLETKKNELNSALWHHPTLWGYLYKRVVRKVK